MNLEMYTSVKSILAMVLVLYLTAAFVDWNCNKEMEEVIKSVSDSSYNYSDSFDTTGDILVVENELNREKSKLYPHTRVEEFEDYVVEDTQEQIDDEIAEGEIELLAQLIEAEAAIEDYWGKCLVADVVLNRVDSDIFPDSISGVIFEHHIRKSDGIDCYQFSTVKYGTFTKAGWSISEDSFKAAKQEYDRWKRGDHPLCDEEILYFTAGEYNECCIPMYVHGRHYFGK